MKDLIIRCISFFSLLRFRFRKNISLGKGIRTNFRLKIKGPGKVTIGDNVNMWCFKEPNEFLTFSSDAEIVIGSHTRINGAIFQARSSIKVGERCLIGSAQLIDNDFHHTDPVKRFDKTNIPTSPIIVGNNVWLAGQCAVLKGVSIGDNSVVGFRAVVTRNVEKNMVVAGNPAQAVKQI